MFLCGCYECVALGLIDPGDFGQFRWVWLPVSESGRVLSVGGIEGVLSVRLDFGGGAVVDRRRGVQADT